MECKSGRRTDTAWKAAGPLNWGCVSSTLHSAIDRNLIKELFNNGKSKSEIAKILKCANSTITLALKS